MLKAFRLLRRHSTTVKLATKGSELEECVKILEGKAKILFPKGEVFYNPVQVFNRDLSVAVIDHYSKHFWDPTKRCRQSAPYWKHEAEKRINEEHGSQKINSDLAVPQNQVLESPDQSNESMDQISESMDQGTESMTESINESTNQGSESMNQKTESSNQVMDQGTESMTDQEPRSINVAAGLENNSQCPETESCMDPRKSLASLSILDALSASGLRSIRYALEVPLAGKITANDISDQAHKSIINNISVNGVGDKVSPSLRDASLLMYECKTPPTNRYDVVDIDPYGSPTNFLDSAVQACHDGGLLCVTCTDTSILCGNHSETCHAKYGSMSIKTKYCHEMALRIILACIESHANRYRRYIVPVLSCSIDFYCRVFVMVYTSAFEVKKSASKLAMVYHCIGCSNFHLQRLGKTDKGKKGGIKFTNATGPPVGGLCDNCGSTFKFGGPIWADPIHDAQFLKGLIQTAKESNNTYKTIDRMEGLVTMASEELPEVPLYYVLDELGAVLHCNSIKMGALRSAILDQGYSVSLSHTRPNAVKTNAPQTVVWDIMKCWVKQNPVKNLKNNSPAKKILQQETKLNASFKIRSDAFPLSKVLKLARFPENPEPNWGPKARAKRKLEDSEASSEEKIKSIKKPFQQSVSEIKTE